MSQSKPSRNQERGTQMAYKAIVVGALGVIGRYIVERLEQDPDWEVIGISRRQGPSRQRVQYLALDLLDAESCERRIAAIDGITHVFYAAFQPTPGPAAGYASNIDANRNMLVNAVSAVATHHASLQRVILVTGTKYYGIHLGPIKTPARETDSRHIPPNYYFDQIDWLMAYQANALSDASIAARSWDWVELRPQTLCGFAPGTAMSLVPVIAVYAALSKDLGLALRFPGKHGAWTSLYQVTDSSHFAEAALWAALEVRASNQAFNITNGDYFRWCNIWPSIARVFDMPWDQPQTISLSQQMPALKSRWEALQQRYDLQKIDFEALVAWPFGDYVFGSDWDVMTSTTKARQFGFHAVVDSEQMFIDLLGAFRRERITP
jgi:nucleoside-diphosphate-sugar epimerase